MANKSADTLSQLMAIIKSNVESAVKEDLAIEAEKELDKNMDSTVYKPTDNYSTYQHTHAMRNAIDNEVKSSGSEIELEVFSNPEKMLYDYPSVSKKSSQDNRDMIVGWLNYGHGGIWDYPEQLFIEKTQESMNSNAKKILKKALKKRGIDSV